MNGVTILFVYAVIMILATVILTKKEKNVERFCVGSRSENWLMSALSIAATWIWAPALFVSTEKAYSTGWVGLFWFLVPNALCLVIFIPFAKKIRKEMPEGMTLSGYMKEKYQSDGVKRVYLFQLIGLSVLSTLSMGILGFMGAGAGYQAQNLGIINFELIRHFFPSWAVLPFLFMIVSGLLSTVDSNLCAVSSLTTDIAGGKDIRKTRAAMAVLLIAGILIANIPGITVTHLFLFYGTLRASTLLPTVMTLKGVRLNAKGIITGVVAALAVGLPVFAYGSVLNSGPYKTLGSLLTVLLSGLIALAASGKERHYAR